jgi:hypothetical protein
VLSPFWHKQRSICFGEDKNSFAFTTYIYVVRLLSLSSLSQIPDSVSSKPFYAVLGVELIFAERERGENDELLGRV